MSLGRRNILKVTVKNTGRRAAFVKAVCYAGIVLRCGEEKLVYFTFAFLFFVMNCYHFSRIVHIA